MESFNPTQTRQVFRVPPSHYAGHAAQLSNLVRLVRFQEGGAFFNAPVRRKSPVAADHCGDRHRSIAGSSFHTYESQRPRLSRTAKKGGLMEAYKIVTNCPVHEYALPSPLKALQVVRRLEASHRKSVDGLGKEQERQVWF